jgi:hypothetical protein
MPESNRKAAPRTASIRCTLLFASEVPDDWSARRTEFRLRGVMQHDISRLEESPAGSFVIRYLEGALAEASMLQCIAALRGLTDEQIEQALRQADQALSRRNEPTAGPSV